MIYLLLCTVIIGLITVLYAIATAKLDPTEKQYATSYVVYYQPNISDDGKRIIRSNINPTMSSEDSFLYSIEDIFLQVKDDLSVQDLSFLANLEKRGIEYIEI